MPFWRHAHSPGVEHVAGLWLIAGLGNPGSRYEGTRHNIGFMAVERLAEQEGIRFKGSKHRADTARGTVAGVQVLLAMPLTYMNESGNAVSRLMAYYQIPRSRLLVICDDMDLPFATLRLRPNGSAGGQRGLASIIQALDSNEFARLRIGVSRPAEHAIAHVLGKFPPEEQRVLPELLDKAGEAVAAAITAGIPESMNLYNRNWLEALV